MTSRCDVCTHPVSDDTLSVEAWEAHGIVAHALCPPRDGLPLQVAGMSDGRIQVRIVLPTPAPRPVRVWLRRTKGWRMPPNTVKVTRGTGMRWGNPYVVGDHRITRQTPGQPYAEPTPENCVKWFRAHVVETPGMIDKIRAELRGKNLACWCRPGAPCHANILLEIANG